MDLHSARIQDILDEVNWEDYFVPGEVYRLIAKRKNGKAADSHGMRNEFLKILQ